MSLRSAVRIGLQRPNLLTLPSDRRGSAGPEVVDLAATAGLILDDWQGWVLEQAMAEQRDGRWSAFEVGVEVGRQCGKGAILEARQLAGLTLLHERLQVHTAHEFKTCFEHFLRMVQLVEANPDIDRQVIRIRRGAGEQAIEMRGGERLRFLARSGGSGRGMSGDVVYLDEAFALTRSMMGALLPTLSARQNPQVWYTSSAPMSTSVVQHSVRRRAVAGGSPRLFYAAWENMPGTDPEDRDAWARANPALGIRISEEFIEAELVAMSGSIEEFARERLGIPDPEPTPDDGMPVKLPPDEWRATAVPASRAPTLEGVRLAFDVAPNGQCASVAVAVGTLSAPWVQLIEHRQGVGWLPEFVAGKVMQYDAVVGCDSVGPAADHLPAIREALELAGVPADRLKPLTSAEYRAACGAFYTDVIEGRLSRPMAPNGERDLLDVTAEDAAERRVGDGWVWNRRRATVPVSPLVAVTVARSLLEAAPSAVEPMFAVSR